MFTTDHRPAPLPNRAGNQQPRQAGGSLPPGAVRWSTMWLDTNGMPHTADTPVPVDAVDRQVTTHTLHICPGRIEVAGAVQPCDTTAWLAAGQTRYCGDHGVQLQPDKQVTTRPGFPTREMAAANRHRIHAAAVTAATFGAAAGADYTTMPWWGVAAQYAAIPAVVASSWWLTRWWLTRDAVRRGRLDSGDEIAGKRRRRLIDRRARYAAYCAATAAGWVAVADWAGLDFTTTTGPALTATLGIAAAVCARPYLRWADQKRAAAPPAAPPVDDPDDGAGQPAPEPDPNSLQQLATYVTARWTQFVATSRGPLPGTVVEDITQTSTGGWSATIVATETSDLDPEKYVEEKTLRRIARPFNVGTNMVSITADPQDANRAFILVQRISPLQGKGRPWDGSGIDLSTGRAETVTLDDGSRGSHEFWRPGWGAVMELLAGATGSGKSEYLNLLLALERQCGHVVSWVGDPQMGQSLGDIRDGVDWFAPTVEEILLMLRTARQVMFTRNVLITRMRAEDDKGRQRRVKYVDVSPDFPLLSISIDEAYLPMGDPDHGPEIVKLLALLAKSGRKCNIKIRLMSQSPLLSELKDSVLRGQVASGLVTVFRTADKLTGSAAWPGKMPADPAALPATWPDGVTAAGVCYMSNQRPLKARTDYAGDVYDLMHAGTTLGLEPAVRAAAGVVYADRVKRLAAFDALDPAELVGAEMPDLRVDAADAGASKPGGRDAVLRFLADRWQDGDHSLTSFGDIDSSVSAVKTRALSNVLKKLVDDQLLVTETGAYALSARGAEELGLG